MRFHWSHAVLGVFAALVLAAPAAHAFTMENRDASGPYTVPLFDLGEQSKQFSKSGTDTAPALGQRSFSTPFGPGTVEFGVRAGIDLWLELRLGVRAVLRAELWHGCHAPGLRARRDAGDSALAVRAAALRLFTPPSPFPAI